MRGRSSQPQANRPLPPVQLKVCFNWTEAMRPTSNSRANPPNEVSVRRSNGGWPDHFRKPTPGYLLKYKYYMGLSRLLISVSIDGYSTFRATRFSEPV